MPIARVGSVMDVHKCFEPHPPLLRKLYVRECYQEVWLRSVTKYLLSKARNEYLYITGTPGIGKTAFLYYLLCRLKAANSSYEVLLQFGKTVVFLSSKPMPPIALSLLLSSKHSLISIFDPDNGSAETNWDVGLGYHIVVASPDPRHTRPFNNRYNCTKVIMSVWSYEEIKACHNLVYSDLKWKEVDNLFTKWGKTPRICFTLRDDTMEESLLKVLRNPDKVGNMMERMLSDGPFSDNKEDEDCQRFTQINSNHSITWSSPYIRAQFYSKFGELFTSLQNRTELLKQANYIKLGVCYEAFIIKEFTVPVAKDYTLQASILPKSNSSYHETVVLEWPESTQYFCSGQCFADIVPQRLYVPDSATFPMIDLVYPPYLLQITTSSTHSVSRAGYNKIRKVFPNVKEWVLIFIIPIHRGKTFHLASNSMQYLEQLKVPAYKLIMDYPDMRKLQDNPS